MLVKHIVTQYDTEPEIAKLSGCILRTKTKDLCATGADYQRDRQLYSISSANMKTFFLPIMTHSLAVYLTITPGSIIKIIYI